MAEVVEVLGYCPVCQSRSSAASVPSLIHYFSEINEINTPQSLSIAL